MKAIKFIFKTIFTAIITIVSALIIISICAGILVASLNMMENITPPKKGSVLLINLQESIVDSPELQQFTLSDLTSPIERRVSLMSALAAIESAASDSNIEGIVIRPDGYGHIDMATLEELRAEIAEFKKSGKFVLAYDSDYSQGDYYLASVADEVYIQPLGRLTWQGIASNTLYFKGLLERLDVDVEVFRPEACTYKSAVEPLTRSSISPENREQSSALISSLWGVIVDQVARSRDLSVGELNRYADSLSLFMPERARLAGMVDGVIYEDQFIDILDDMGVEVDDGKPEQISLYNYALLHSKRERREGDKLAVIYAEGEIVDGRGSALQQVGGDALAAKLRRVREDDDIKGVVLRVNSPGGSALASEIIWREMELLRKEKPTVVSMGGYAASGGYYISCPADVILTDRLTITGSIGVFGMMFNLEDALRNKLGITIDGVTSNASADFGRVARASTPTEYEAMMRSVDGVYNSFVDHVSSGRNLSRSRVEGISGGRIWSGEEAMQVGLADGYGGLKKAISLAAERSGLDSNNLYIEEILDEPTPLQMALSSFAVKLSTWNKAEAQPLAEYQKLYDQIRVYSSDSGLYLYSPFRIESR